MPLAELERLLEWLREDDAEAGYQAFVAAMAPDCRCLDTVCAGVLAGGLCDTWPGEERDPYERDDEPYEAQGLDDLDAEGELS